MGKTAVAGRWGVCRPNSCNGRGPIAKSRSLSEANERIALLEKNIKELRRSAGIEDLALADMQQAEEPTPMPPHYRPRLRRFRLAPADFGAPFSDPVRTLRAEAGNREKQEVTSLATVGSATK